MGCVHKQELATAHAVFHEHIQHGKYLAVCQIGQAHVTIKVDFGGMEHHTEVIRGERVCFQTVLSYPVGLA